MAEWVVARRPMRLGGKVLQVGDPVDPSLFPRFEGYVRLGLVKQAEEKPKPKRARKKAQPQPEPADEG